MKKTNSPVLIRAQTRYTCIKNYYLKCGHDEQQWQAVSQKPSLFNAVWRQMIGAPSGDMPPPEPLRR